MSRRKPGWLVVFVALALTVVIALGYQRYEDQRDRREIDRLVCEYDPMSC